jgi:putative holliday junction resolvase
MSSPSPAPAGRIAGIDHGSVRIGIAITDPERRLASPYENYTRRGLDQDARRMRRLVEEEGVKLFVVGLPVHLSGRESQQSVAAQEFGAWLGQITGVPVEYFDERMTSLEAEGFLLDAGLTRKHRKARKDMLAAQILLSAYLESRGKASANPGALDD